MITNLSMKELCFGVGSVLSTFIGSTIVHEYSHMAAMRLLFPNLNPYMSCDGIPAFSTCRAHWGGIPVLQDVLPMTYQTGYGIVYAAGPIADIANVAISSIVAWKMRHFNEKVSLLFASHAFLRSLKVFDYCFSTLGTNVGDFALVELNLGVSHYIQAAIVSSVALGATAMLTKLLFFSKEPMEMSAKKNM